MKALLGYGTFAHWVAVPALFFNGSLMKIFSSDVELEKVIKLKRISTSTNLIDRFPMTSYLGTNDCNFVQFKQNTERNAAAVSLQNVSKRFPRLIPIRMMKRSQERKYFENN